MTTLLSTPATPPTCPAHPEGYMGELSEERIEYSQDRVKIGVRHVVAVSENFVPSSKSHSYLGFWSHTTL